MALESGVKDYVKGTATVTVNFPVDSKGKEYLRCVYCPFLSANKKICRLNSEIVAFPDQFVGDKCPLTIEESKHIPEGMSAFGED